MIGVGHSNARVAQPPPAVRITIQFMAKLKSRFDPMRARINLREYLTGGDRRSLGRAKELHKLMEERIDLFPQLLRCMWDSDPIVAMRSADALEKITRSNAKLLQPFKKELLGLAAEAEQPELRWHLALMAPRLKLTPAEQRRAIAILVDYLSDRSAIVKTHALQALFETSRKNRDAPIDMEEILNTAARTGTAAMRARARILLAEMTTQSRGKQRSGAEPKPLNHSVAEPQPKAFSTQRNRVNRVKSKT